MARLQDPASLGTASSQWLLDELCGRFHHLSMQGPSNVSAGLGSPLLTSLQPVAPPGYGVNAAALGDTGGLLDPALQQLAALHALNQQQSLGVPSVTADNLLPLINLSNLLAAQRLGSNMQEAAELLAFKDGLRQSTMTTGSTTSSGQRGSGPLHNPLYKTELCRSWEEIGSCRYGAKCQFAHGREELRPVQRHPKYKTEVCRTFAQTGTCPYGTRCRFIHHDATLASLKAPASRGSSASSLNTMLLEPPRSPAMAGLAIAGGPFSQVALAPLSPSPSTTFAPGGAPSPSTPPASAPAPSSAAAALASLLSAAANANATAGVSGAAPGSAPLFFPLPPPVMDVGGLSSSTLAALGLGGPGPFLPPSDPSPGDLPPIGVPIGHPVGTGADLGTTALAPPTPLAIPCASTLPTSGSGGLASAPPTPTATHTGSKVVRRLSLDDDVPNHRLPIFARLGAEKDGEGGKGASPAPGPDTASNDSS